MALQVAQIVVYYDEATTGNVDAIVAYAKSLAQQAEIVGGLSAEERQSYGLAGTVQGDGSILASSQWRQTVYGVKDGPPELSDTDLSSATIWSAAAVVYAIDDFVTDAGSVWRCIQAHTSQAGWNPAAVPALWTSVAGVSGA